MTTLYNVCSVHRGGVQYIGDTMSTSGDIMSHQGMFSIHRGDIMSHQGMFSIHRGDTMSTSGGYLSTSGRARVQYIGGYHDACGDTMCT